MNSFEDLDVWKHARELRINISKLSKQLPSTENYKLKDQLVRASRSITANIAEGFGRFHYQENIQFCRQARGSLFETLDHLICCKDESYIDEKVLEELKQQINEVNRLLNGYINYLLKAKQNNTSK